MSDAVSDFYDDAEYGPKCPSCGVEFIQHLGITGTCARVQELEKRVRELEQELKDQREAENLAVIHAVSMSQGST